MIICYHHRHLRGRAEKVVSFAAKITLKGYLAKALKGQNRGRVHLRLRQNQSVPASGSEALGQVKEEQERHLNDFLVHN